MIGKRLFFALAAALMATGLSRPPRVSPQQNPPCANAETAGRTAKQIQLDACSCEQSAAQDKPAYRVGVAPFGRKAQGTQRAVPRAGKPMRVGARRGQSRSEPEDLYGGLEMPDLKDLKSPEVVGLRQKVSSAREEARRKVEESELRRKALLQTRPNDWYTHNLNSPKARKRYEQFI